MKTILVPTDFSANALNALKYAFAFAEKTNSKIVLFHSYTSPTSDLNIGFTDLYFEKREAGIEAELKMKKMLVKLLKSFPNVKPKWIISQGLGSTGIVDYVKGHNINMIIMGTTGRSAITRTVIGSTTSHVIKHAPCSIIAVPPRAKFKGLNKIAVATDLNKDTQETNKDMIDFAREFDAEIMFVHIQDLEFFDEKDMYPEMADKIRKHTKYKKISYHIFRNSNIEHGLDAFIRKHKPDVLLMAAHSRKFPEIIWETSRTKNMSNHISIPLLIVPIVPKPAKFSKTLKPKGLASTGV